MSGNDYDHWQDPKNDEVVTSLALGIKEKDNRHIQTIELHSGTSVSSDDPKWLPIVSLNAAYCYGPPYIQVLRGYNTAKTMPSSRSRPSTSLKASASRCQHALYAASPGIWDQSQRADEGPLV